MQNSREPFEITVTNKRSTEIRLFKLLKEQKTNRENGRFHMVGKTSSRLPSSCKFSHQDQTFQQTERRVWERSSHWQLIQI